MNLPIQIRTEPGSEPVISVDGAWGAPGLNLSHWPGNETPAALKHDLSTGSALAFSALPRAERDALAAGCVAIRNNHVDTDGVCATFAVARPDEALPRADVLLRAARAGDFFRPEDEEARRLDAILSRCLDAEASPWREETRGLSDEERYTFDVNRLVEFLPAILDGERADLEELVAPQVEDWRADRADLRAAALDDLAHLDLAVWTGPEAAASSRTYEPTSFFDPARQALWSTHFADRVLVIGRAPAGTTYRFLVSTLSWFDQRGHPCLPRPDLAKLAARLNELGGTDPGGDAPAWHAQRADGASPELYFGARGLPSFPEHASSHLAPCSLDALAVRSAVIDALRETWVFLDD